METSDALHAVQQIVGHICSTSNVVIVAKTEENFKISVIGIVTNFCGAVNNSK